MSHAPRLVRISRPCVCSKHWNIFLRVSETHPIVHSVAEKHSFASMSFNKWVYQLNRYAKTGNIFVFSV